MHSPRLNHAVSSLAFLLSLMGLQACGGEDDQDHGDPHGHEGESTLGRLTVSDTENAAVYVVDLDEGEVTTLEVAAPGAYVSSEATGRYSFLSHYGDDRFEVVDTGITVTSHDDHFHVSLREPQKHRLAIDGLAPSHVVTGNDYVAVYFDGDGRLGLFEYDALRGTGTITPEYVEANRPHHGVGVPFGDSLLLTHAVEATEVDEEEGWLEGVPVGLTIRAWEDPTKIARTIQGCTKLHGEAILGDVTLFACDEGVLRLSTEEDGSVVDDLLPYPEDIEMRTWGFVHGDGDVAIGDSGTGILRVDAASGEVTLHALTDGAARKAQAASGDGRAFYVLDTEGRLHCYKAGDFGSCGAPLEVMEPIGVEDRALVVSGVGHAYVLDGRDGNLYIVDADDWSLEEAPLTLPGKPFSAALTGRMGGGSR